MLVSKDTCRATLKVLTFNIASILELIWVARRALLDYHLPHVNLSEGSKSRVKVPRMRIFWHMAKGNTRWRPPSAISIRSRWPDQHCSSPHSLSLLTPWSIESPTFHWQGGKRHPWGGSFVPPMSRHKSCPFRGWCSWLVVGDALSSTALKSSLTVCRLYIVIESGAFVVIIASFVANERW